MKCTYSTSTIDRVVHFHGHRCPGLAIGIRAAELAAREFPDTPATSLVCITETDMCGVDAIQFLTGCTFGKGNLMHRDYGKMAFSFFDRSSDRGIRLVLKDYQPDDERQEMAQLMADSLTGELSDEGRRRLSEMRQRSEEVVMSLPLDELFTMEHLDQGPPRPARILQSLTCAACSEKTMESRTRRLAGRTLCIPCFRNIEQKQ
ncbi:MAG: TraR/DksA C4-type zinc finger protein [Desulfofustis sp.]|nr:TraR/DksA C4-type zinc finger protein [Desulfofustis sp.]